MTYQPLQSEDLTLKTAAPERRTVTDKELLTAAARAAGYEVARVADDGESLLLVGVQEPWNPLADDGQALRLAVALRLEIDIHHTGIAARTPNGLKALVRAEDEPDANSATRRCITRAAASMGGSNV